MLLVLCLINPANAGEVLACGVPGGIAVTALCRRYVRRVFLRMQAEKEDVRRMIRENDALEARVRELEGR